MQIHRNQNKAKRKIWEEKRYKKLIADTQKSEVVKAKRKRNYEKLKADPQKSQVTKATRKRWTEKDEKKRKTLCYRNSIYK
jgi:hypothetical protein